MTDTSSEEKRFRGEIHKEAGSAEVLVVLTLEDAHLTIKWTNPDTCYRLVTNAPDLISELLETAMKEAGIEVEDAPAS